MKTNQTEKKKKTGTNVVAGRKLNYFLGFLSRESRKKNIFIRISVESEKFTESWFIAFNFNLKKTQTVEWRGSRMEKSFNYRVDDAQWFPLIDHSQINSTAPASHLHELHTRLIP